MATQRAKPARGLLNVGNTCYLNSVVQSLNAFPLFDKYISSLKQHGPSNGLLEKLKDTLDALKSEGGVPFRPSLVGDESLRKHFKPGEQQDAHEFLTFLLDEIVSGGASPSGPAPVEEARASGLAFLISGDAKEKPRRAIATTRSHMDAASYSTPSYLSLGESAVFGPNGASAVTAHVGFNLRESLSPSKAASMQTAKSNTSRSNLTSSLSFHSPNVQPSYESSLLPASAFLNSSMLLNQAVRKSKKSAPSPFMGKMESTIHCHRCRSTWSTIQPMTMLSAYIPPTSEPTLQDCIVGFCKSEDVRGVFCQHCKSTSRVQKRLSVAKAPDILCIFINRLKYEKIGASLAPKKLDSHVKFDLTFDLAAATSQLSLKMGAEDRVDNLMSRFPDSASALSGSNMCAPSQSSTTASPSPRNHFNGRDTPSEASSVVSTSEFTASRDQRLNQTVTTNSMEFEYQLMAIIVHLGNSHGGHYIMFKAPKGDPETGNWLQISDSDVREVPFSHVQRQHAYMLFYQKILSDYDPQDSIDESILPSPASPPLFYSPIPSSKLPTLLHPNGTKPNGFHSSEEIPLSNGHVHHPTPLGSSSTTLSSSSLSSSTGPTSSPEPEEDRKSKIFLEPEESPVPDLNDPLRTAQGLPLEMLQRPLQDLGDHYVGFDSILTSQAES